ncbi:hypothetical protein RAL92_21805 [Metapseudomonas otitidis]|uniref:hypothetical protein n=1 Tax=Metapseudomonas otitidis TaxID=319939 RepID=UPI00321794AC
MVITEDIFKRMSHKLIHRIMRGFAGNERAMAPAAKEYLKQRKIEEQIIAYDEEMKRRHAAIVEAKRCKVDCKPHPTQECLKPYYTIGADVIGCSKEKLQSYDS